MNTIQQLSIVIFICLFGISSHLNAQSFMPSPQQIEQFKNLPRAQQEQLARQMGFDISMLNNPQSAESTAQSTEQIDFFEPQSSNEEIAQSLAEQSIISEESSTLLPFGYEIFESREQASQPISNLPVPSNYIIGPGDSINLQLFGKETGTYQLIVNNEGNIDLPELGPLLVHGSSFEELKTLVKENYSQQKIGVTPFISMGQLRTIQIFLVGEVNKPGPLIVSGLSTITTALLNSGGVNKIGSLRNIELKRLGKTVAQFDLYDLILKGDISNDIKLEQGDVLFVPTAQNIVSIDGLVRRPAIYELTENEKIEDLLRLAGGILPKGDANSLQLVRKNQVEGLSIINVNANKPSGLKQVLQNGDFLRVSEGSLEFNNAIMVNGAINMPSLVADNDLFLSDIITERTVFSNTDLHYALLIRKEKFSNRSEVIQFKPIDVLKGKFNKGLVAFDELFFFNLVVHDKVEGVEQLIAEDNLQSAQDDIRTEQDTYSQNLSTNNFTTENFTKTSNKDFSRKALLSPVIARLKSEASNQQNVQLFEVTGEVKYPGIYPKPHNISLQEALYATGGLTESAHLEDAEITSVDIQEGSLNISHNSINLLSQLLLPKSQQVKLNSKDVLNIVRIPQWYESNVITLKGEIRFPGTYQIKRGETLGSVLKRAGGLTNQATVNAAVFTREELVEKEKANIDKAIEDLRQQLANNSLSTSQFTKSVDYTTANEVLNDLTDIKPIGRMVIDIESIISGNANADIIVKDGDELVIPNITPAISIIGEVFVSSTHRFDANLTIDDYLDLAGGIREYGDASNIYIVKANGAVTVPKTEFWFSSSPETLLSPGDTIVVPRDVTNYDNISLWQGVTQIVYQTAVALAAIGSL